jgi:hypothetical protein
MPPTAPNATLMDAIIRAAHERKRPRDVAICPLLRFTGMRRDSVATLRLGQLDGEWSPARGVPEGRHGPGHPRPGAGHLAALSEFKGGFQSGSRWYSMICFVLKRGICK